MVGEDVEVVIAGSGIAGLSAAVFASRYGRRTVVLTGGNIGGHLLSVNTIEDFIGFSAGVAGYELCPAIQEQAARSGATFMPSSLKGLAREGERLSVMTDGDVFSSPAVILATGSELTTLNVPGESELRGKGVCECASCDGPLFRGKVVGAVGGGDSALLESLELAEHVERVILFTKDESLHGQLAYRQRVMDHPSIEIRYETVIEEIVGDGAVEGVQTRGSSGNMQSLVPLSAIFVYVGVKPRTDYLSDLVALDAEGRVPTDAGLRSAARGILAAGDVRSGASGQAVSAAGDGATAAIYADKYLKDGRWTTTLEPWGIT